MNAVEYNGVKYWYGYNCYDAFLTMGIEKKIGVYKELPDIYNDKTFHWRKNRKYDSQECVVEDGLFEYHCIYKADQNGTVDIKYAACDNRHRNKVTIATIDVEYASNIAFNKAIRQWKKQFKESVKSM